MKRRSSDLSFHRIPHSDKKVYHVVGAQNLQKLKMMIRQNIIHNFPVTVEYIEIAKGIFGTDVSTLNGRTMIQIPKVVVDGFIEIPREIIENNQELILCMDMMFIYQQSLLTKIDKDIRFFGLVLISNRTKE